MNDTALKRLCATPIRPSYQHAHFVALISLKRLGMWCDLEAFF